MEFENILIYLHKGTGKLMSQTMGMFCALWNKNEMYKIKQKNLQITTVGFQVLSLILKLC